MDHDPHDIPSFITDLTRTDLDLGRVRRRRLLRSTFSVLAFVCLAIVVGGSIAIYRFLDDTGVFDLGEKNLALIISHRAADNTIVYDRKGQKIGEFFSNYHAFVPFEDLPPMMVKAILSIEDRKFFEHKGIDYRAMLRAIWVHLQGRIYSQGASTITQQVVRYFLLSKEKTFSRKIKEIILSTMLEEKISKEKILEIYANALFLGHGAYGVGAASLRYFGRPLHELKTHELALIAGLFQSPSRYNPHRYPARAKARQMRVLQAMKDNGVISAAELRDLAKVPLQYKTYESITQKVAPYFLDYVQQVSTVLVHERVPTLRNQGLRIYTTLDWEMQKLAEESVAAHQDLFDRSEEEATRINHYPADKRARVEAALLVTRPGTGDIVAMVGGRNYLENQFNRAVSALRSPGSSFKPVVYSQALLSNWKWSDVIYVSPVAIDTYRPYTPRADFLTETTLLRAFYRSMNTPTIEVGQKVGLQNVIALAHKMGVETDIKEEFGAMIGGSEVSMFDLARLYGTFANQGRRVGLEAIAKIETRNGEVIYERPKIALRTEEVLSPQTAFLMTEGMRSVLRYGTGQKSSEISDWAVGKTGTSNDSRDNWFCGYSPRVVAIAWVGTDAHDSLSKSSGGSTLALPIWTTFMKGVAEREPQGAFRNPGGISMVRVHPQYGHVAADGVPMYFLDSNMPNKTSLGLDTIDRSGSVRGLFAK